MTRDDLREMVELVRRQNRVRLGFERAGESRYHSTNPGTPTRTSLGREMQKRGRVERSGRRAEPRNYGAGIGRGRVVA